MLFMTSSEFEPEESNEGTFIILIFERKTIKKRLHDKFKPEHRKRLDAKKMGLKYSDDHWRDRESKMRKFCNYFLPLFNVRKLKPFV